MPRLDDDVLVAYVDGELDESTARMMEAAMEQDPQTRQRVQLFRQSASLIGAVFRQPKYGQSPQTLGRKLVPPVSSPPARARSFWRIALPVAASIVAAAAGFGTGVRYGSTLQSPFTELLLDEVAEYHVVFAREREHQVEVTADRLDEIQSWLGERLGRKFVVPDLSNRGLAFRGARLLVVAHQPVAQLVYSFPDRRDRPFALCITTGSSDEVPLQTRTENGLNLALWGRKGFLYVLAGWIDQSFLTDVAGELAPKLDDV